MNKSSCAAVAGVLSAVVVGACAREVSLHTLVDEMTDLTALTRFPDPPYTCKQFSSYDRASKSPQENWFANADAGHFLREETNGKRTEYVMMDANGPGAVVRIWSANPNGTLRVYLDGNPEPAIEVLLADWTGGKVDFNPEPISHVASRGWNSYFPIPYAKHCKITSDKNGFYYHVNYRTYPPGTKVKTFAQAQVPESPIQPVARRLASPRGDAGSPAAAATPVELEPGESRTVASFADGPMAVSALQFFDLKAPDVEAALRSTVLTIAFDGKETVCAPLGDFFGTAPGLSPYESIPLGVTDKGLMWSHWRMPFRKQAALTLTNRGENRIALKCTTETEPYTWDDRSMYFHAEWRIERDIPTVPKRDWNFVETTGRGVFVGSAMYIANPVRNWWGEGDEKIYVDGETFPSHFGTGTEDYFGYAWCTPDVFNHAYHNQPRCDGPGNYGHTAVNRWHVIDNIPYTRDFKFDMEIWHWSDCKLTVGAICYWYAHPGGTDNYKPLARADLRVPFIPPYVIPKVEGALEGENFRVIDVTGNARPQNLGEKLSNEKHVWWTDNKPGDRLTLGFEVEEPGRYRVLARLVTAGDYGIAALSINDQPAGDPVDLYTDGIKVTDNVDLGTFDLTAGENTLTAEIVGKNEKSSNYMFGLDYLLLKTPE
ncbi:MAG: DUF2961 domain-containing protein [Phycisphaerales bacterium]|nr:MAG: DUF2961 domain-containing protein [Phycisphaerales bacterium]